jgi:hypothetical protein
VSIAQRLKRLDWNASATSLTERGFALLPSLLSQQECTDLIAMYERQEMFRSRINMAQFRFGKGEYQYFSYPLPPLIEHLRHELYPKLAPIANDWADRFGTEGFPCTLGELTELCRRHGQTRPTPLLLRYTAGDFNCLHQDIYGEIAFPLQVVFFLSQPDRDYTGGEFLLMEQHPRAQSVGRVLRPQQGDAVVITTRYRPAQGKRGTYRVGVRHGVSEVTSGQRWTLGIIFHDAK